MATDQFGSGGGFSWYSKQFAAQEAAVQAYLTSDTNLPPHGSFSAAGRATPDVAAMGEGFQVIINGETEDVGGTSASAPTFAGIVSLLNEALIAAGKPHLGHLNPFVYQHADAFTDIIHGTNAIDRGGAAVPYGFNATKGWDGATGVGTPVFTKLLDAAMAL